MLSKLFSLNQIGIRVTEHWGNGFTIKAIILAEAVDPFAEALRLDPKNGLHYCSLGVVYYRLQEYEKAVEYLQKAVLMKSPEKRNKFRTPTQIKHTLIFLWYEQLR